MRDDPETRRLVEAREQGHPVEAATHPLLGVSAPGARNADWFHMKNDDVIAMPDKWEYPGDAFTVECPTGSGRQMTLFEVAHEIGRRLSAIFLRGPDRRRPVFGDVKKFQTDPSWRDHLQFYEYFHGDNGAGIGANHQTGWTGLVAKVLQLFGTISPETVLSVGAREAGGMPAPPGLTTPC
jgi:hypothetical protein